MDIRIKSNADFMMANEKKRKRNRNRGYKHLDGECVAGAAEGEGMNHYLILNEHE